MGVEGGNHPQVAEKFIMVFHSGVSIVMGRIPKMVGECFHGKSHRSIEMDENWG